jgi:hypothetical protein
MSAFGALFWAHKEARLTPEGSHGQVENSLRNYGACDAGESCGSYPFFCIFRSEVGIGPNRMLALFTPTPRRAGESCGRLPRGTQERSLCGRGIEHHGAVDAALSEELPLCFFAFFRSGGGHRLNDGAACFPLSRRGVSLYPR